MKKREKDTTYSLSYDGVSLSLFADACTLKGQIPTVATDNPFAINSLPCEQLMLYARMYKCVIMS